MRMAGASLSKILGACLPYPKFLGRGGMDLRGLSAASSLRSASTDHCTR